MRDLLVFAGGRRRNSVDYEVEVTVVVPVFNAEKWLPELLKCLAAQDTPVRWELIIGDNGSSDASLSIARAFSDQFDLFSVVDASDKRGPSHARNTAAAAAKGKLILFCDADDEPDPFWIHQMYRAWRPGRILAGRLEPSKLNSDEARMWRPDSQNISAPSFYGHVYAMSSNMGCGRDDFIRLKGFDERFTTAAGEDVDLPIRARRLGIDVEFVPAAIIHYRLRAGKSAAIKQARAYGRAAAHLFALHEDQLSTPTIRYDLREYAQLLLMIVVGRLLHRSDRRAEWSLYFHLAQTRGLALRRQYWSLRSEYMPDGAGISARGLYSYLKVARRLTLDALQAGRTAKASTPWDYSAAFQQSLSATDRHLLGAALLADADITIQAFRGGVRWHMNPALDSIVSGLIEEGSYSEAELRAVDGWLRNAGRLHGDRQLVVNVGANIGTTALGLARAGYRVLAIEPVPRAAELLERNVSANGFETMISIARYAVASTSGVVEMVAGANLSTSEVRSGHPVEALASPGDSSASVLTVPAHPLSKVLAEHGVHPDNVAAVWSDTEGSEAEVIRSATDLWQAGTPLWVEIRPSALADQGRITDFCALVSSNFRTFYATEDLAGSAPRDVSEFREFVDSVGYGRWDFTNVLLVA